VDWVKMTGEMPTHGNLRTKLGKGSNKITESLKRLENAGRIKRRSGRIISVAKPVGS